MSFSICSAAGLMSISSPVTPSAFISCPRVRLRALRRREARHREAEDVLARQTERVERLGGDDQRVRRIETARDADDDALAVRHLHALHQALHLDVERFVAVLVEPRRVVRHERKAVDRGARARRPRSSGWCSNAMRLNAVSGWPAATAALLNVSVRMRSSRRRSTSTSATAIWLFPRKALGAGELRAELVDRRLAVPREIGRALAGSRRRIDVGRHAAHRLRGAQHRAVVRLADHDVRRRQIAENQRAGERALRRGRRRRPRSPRRSRRGR